MLERVRCLERRLVTCFWAVEKRVRLVFRGFWRNGSLCRRAALVLFCSWVEITGILSASVFNMERCAVGPRPQGLLERPGEDFCLGGRQKAWDRGEERKPYRYSAMYKVNPPPKRPPHDSATTTQLRVESFTAIDSPRHNHASESSKSSAIGLVSSSRAFYAQQICV
jgi:hypothetical protein